MLERADSGVAPSDFYSAGHPLPLGRIDPAWSLPPLTNLPLPARSRNNQVAFAALNQIRPAVDDAIERFGSHRVGVVIGTSTSGIADGEKALREYGSSGILPSSFHYGQQELGSPAATLAQTLGTTGPAFTHSSACASSAKALASAARLILMKACDAVIAGGVDTLCAFTLAGFAALESVSATRCNPLSRNRNGINIGEGAALFLMSCQPAASGTVRLGRVLGRSSHVGSRSCWGRRAVGDGTSVIARGRLAPRRWITSTCTVPRRYKTTRWKRGSFMRFSAIRFRSARRNRLPDMRWARQGRLRLDCAGWLCKMIIPPASCRRIFGTARPTQTCRN